MTLFLQLLCGVKPYHPGQVHRGRLRVTRESAAYTCVTFHAWIIRGFKFGTQIIIIFDDARLVHHREQTSTSNRPVRHCGDHVCGYGLIEPRFALNQAKQLEITTSSFGYTILESRHLYFHGSRTRCLSAKR